MRIAIRGAGHFLFSDDGALLKSRILMGALRMFGVIGIDRRRQLAVTTYCVHSFFDAYLTGGRRFAARPLIAALSRDPGSEVMRYGRDGRPRTGVHCAL
jgi:hypothetical protein